MTTKRYEFLDGMRGVAAIMVLIRHTPDLWHFSLFHSYLAVDLFFMLSGFVIAGSYEQRLSTRSLAPKQFLIIRLIRLYPIFLLSVILCALVGIGEIFLGMASYSSADLIGVLLLTSLFLPSRTAGENGLFSVNGPYWSLFYELLTNIIYVTVRKYLSDRLLIIWVIFFGFLVTSACLMHGDLDVGVNWKLSSAAAGFSRAMFGFGLGLLLFRKIEVIKIYVSIQLPLFSFVAVILILATPSIGRFNAIIDLISVFFIFPLCIILSLGPSPKIYAQMLLALGSVSYPIYVFHLPAAQMVSLLSNGNARGGAPFSGLIFVAIMFLFSLYLEKYFDIPTRRYLSKKFS
jgi:peptidoglycan/LPS O-acetylase OafA/YrhL